MVMALYHTDLVNKLILQWLIEFCESFTVVGRGRCSDQKGKRGLFFLQTLILTIEIQVCTDDLVFSGNLLTSVCNAMEPDHFKF
jgi:hypothetical protein